MRLAGGRYADRRDCARHPAADERAGRIQRRDEQEGIVKIVTWKRVVAAAAACLVVCTSRPVTIVASDHADPARLTDPDANITDLFFFPDGDRYVVILDVHRALTAQPPYQLPRYEYRISFDWHTGVSFMDTDPTDQHNWPRDDIRAQTARYGGKIDLSDPKGIQEDATITIHLNADATLNGTPQIKGLLHPDQIRPFAGVRADPFIFPRFFKKNTIAMVFSLPKNAFPDGRGTFLIWAAAFKDGKQVDHVGRSNRTQQGRFDSLNTLPPSMHLDQIMKDMAFWNGWYKRLNKYRETAPLAAALQVLVMPRPMYDEVPDVMIYSDEREHVKPGFPNGRHIQDDVAAITCARGDCILQELSFVEGGWPRRTVSDKPVPPTATFPYLLDPYQEGQFGPSMPAPSPLPSIIPLLLMIGIVVLVIVIVFLYYAALGVRYQLVMRRQREVI